MIDFDKDCLCYPFRLQGWTWILFVALMEVFSCTQEKLLEFTGSVLSVVIS